MNNDEFYPEESEVEKKGFNKKLLFLIIGIVFVIALVLYFVLPKPGYVDYDYKKAKYKISLEGPSVLFVDRPMNYLIKLKGSKQYIDDVVTSYYAKSDDVVELLEDEFYGSSGSVTITPLKEGEDDINIYSVLGVEGDSSEVAQKTMHVIVCPKFDNSLYDYKELSIVKGDIQDISIDFTNDNCKKPITYESSDTNVVTVDEDGMLTAKSVGSSEITVSNGVDTILLTVNVVD